MADTFAARAQGIRLLLCDVDGVLTDGRLYYAANGDEMKAFSTLDGHGLKTLRDAGIEVGLITGRSSDIVTRRARELGLDHLYQGVANKLAVFNEILAATGIPADAAAYVGDDVMDLPVIRRCGLGCTVPAAPEIVLRHAHYVTRREGGMGAVREICDLILDAQGKLGGALAPYLA